jgi:putative phosphoserine phosphatase/1-acylglycerol-3-phosphate O-acyltransferase
MNSNRQPKYAAFYDLDHTILEDNSATHLINEARRRGIMTERNYRRAVWLSILYKLGIGNSTRMIIRMISWLNGLEEQMIRQLCLDVFDGMIREKIRPEILETFEEHRARNGAIVLLSSAQEPITEPIAGYLGMDDIICSVLEVREGILTGNIIGELVYGEEKRNRMLRYCKEHGHDPAEAYYYGDSRTDIQVMESVGHPVAVDPEKRLYSYAMKKHWPILLRDRA